MESPTGAGPLPPEWSRTGLLVLAAGRSERMGVPKGLVRWRGRSLVEHVLSPPLLGHLADVLVVLGHHADRMQPVIARTAYRAVVNPDPDRGRTGSVQVGLRALARQTTGVFIQPVDCPVIRPETYVALIQAAGPADVVIPRYGQKNGHPPLVAARLIPRILAASPQTPLRDLFHGPGVRRKLVDVDDPGVVVNVNCPEDLQQLDRLCP